MSNKHRKPFSIRSTDKLTCGKSPCNMGQTSYGAYCSACEHKVTDIMDPDDSLNFIGVVFSIEQRHHYIYYRDQKDICYSHGYDPTFDEAESRLIKEHKKHKESHAKDNELSR